MPERDDDAANGARPGRRASHRQLSRTGAWRARNWRLRTKMTVVLLVPALTALAFSGLQVRAELTDAGNFNRIVSQVDVSLQITEVVHQLQSERNLVASEVAAGNPALDSNESVRARFRATDAAIAGLRERVIGLDLPDAESKGRYEYAVNQLDQLTPLRDLAQGAVYPDLAVLSTYNSMVNPLVQLGREVSAVGEAPSRLSTAVQTLGQAKERAAQLDALLLVSAAHNTFRAGSVQNQAQSAAAGFDAAVADFLAVATPDERQAYDDGYSGPEVDRRRGIAQTALISPDPTAPLEIDTATLFSTSAAANDKLRMVERDLIAALRDQASGLASLATEAAWRAAGVVIAAMILALALMLRVAWSLVSPLRRLRGGALEVANTILPETIDRILAHANPVEAAKSAVAPMPVYTSEEIGQVARSFDAVHERAVGLATEQAVLRDNVNDVFVNLSRRSQALVERQLAELDKLEQSEQNPDQLSRFFLLDHLAARMRRNSENLLILSGHTIARRSSQPVAVFELIGAALSEVEDYTRVTVKQVPEVVIQGRVVSDIVHLLAELLDNAAKFSPTETMVTVTSARIRSGDLAVQIADEGLGMSEEALAEVNGRLADPPPFDMAVSRRMGLYVVARLAKRHDIQVRLHGDLDAGTSAVVVLPAALTADAPHMTAPLPVIARSSAGGGPPTLPPDQPRSQLAPAGRPTAPKAAGSAWFRRKPPGATDADQRLSAPQEPSWPSSADDRWRMVRNRLVDGATAQQDAIEGGLPKRTPQARLVPGAVPDQQPTTSPPPRSATRIRSRLSGFQEGLNRARQAPEPLDPQPLPEERQ